MVSIFTLYVALVAISNLFLGVLLQRFCPFCDSVQLPETHQREKSAVNLPAGFANQETLPIGIPTLETCSGSQQPDDSLIVEAAIPADAVSEQLGTAIERLPDFFHHLGQIHSRIEYCAGLNDKDLLQSAAKQLAARIEAFYAQFADAVFCTSRSQAQINLLAGIPASEVELLAAQIETTATNISMIDWCETVVDISAKLKHELDHLSHEHKRLVGLSHTESISASQ